MNESTKYELMLLISPEPETEAFGQVILPSTHLKTFNIRFNICLQSGLLHKAQWLPFAGTLVIKTDSCSFI